MPNSDYKALYRVQDTFLRWLSGKGLPFYLTGGTALSRFYLNHRYSDDLDFFVNQYPDFLHVVQQLLNELPKELQVDRNNVLVSADYCRFFLHNDETTLKIEFVNDVGDRVGKGIKTPFGLIDNPANILANKLTAIIGRDEPKDVYDIITLANKYAFSWQSAFEWAKQKAVINEIEVESKLSSFPLEYLNNTAWLLQNVDIKQFEAHKNIVCNDILLAQHNSLGTGLTKIEDATINF